MRNRVLLATIFVTVAFSENTAPRPIQLADILAWKCIQTPIVSANGQWFAYKLAPNEGNSEILLRNLNDGKEQRFPIGELPQLNPGPGGPPMAPPARDLAFSDDSKWVAFLVYPTAKEAKAQKKLRKPVESKLALVELATGKKTDFD